MIVYRCLTYLNDDPPITVHAISRELAAKAAQKRLHCRLEDVVTRYVKTVSVGNREAAKRKARAAA